MNNLPKFSEKKQIKIINIINNITKSIEKYLEYNINNPCYNLEFIFLDEKNNFDLSNFTLSYILYKLKNNLAKYKETSKYKYFLKSLNIFIYLNENLDNKDFRLISKVLYKYTYILLNIILWRAIMINKHEITKQYIDYLNANIKNINSYDDANELLIHINYLIEIFTPELSPIFKFIYDLNNILEADKKLTLIKFLSKILLYEKLIKTLITLNKEKNAAKDILNIIFESRFIYDFNLADINTTSRKIIYLLDTIDKIITNITAFYEEKKFEYIRYI